MVRGKKIQDFVICGAGIVGLTAAWELWRRHPTARILVVEKEGKPGKHASGRNSGVVHAGLYYDPHSLKGQICAMGAKLLRDFCEEHQLPMLQTGKVIVPQAEHLSPMIETLHHRAASNGVAAEIIGVEDLLRLEPAANPHVAKALYVPATASIDPHEVLRKITARLTEAGVQFAFNASIHSIDIQRGKLSCGEDSVFFSHLINTAGAFADRIAHQCGIASQYMMIPFKGTYLRLSPQAPKVQGHIYPVPDLRMPFLGVHFSRSINDEIYVGPTALPTLGRECYSGIDNAEWTLVPQRFAALARQYIFNTQGMRRLVHSELHRLRPLQMFAEARRLVPSITLEHLLKSKKVGIRPQLYNRQTGRLEMDFLMEHTSRSTHVLNAVSPAFTAAFAFAKHICDSMR